MEFTTIKNKGTTATCNNMGKKISYNVLKDQASHGLFTQNSKNSGIQLYRSRCTYK